MTTAGPLPRPVRKFSASTVNTFSSSASSYAPHAFTPATSTSSAGPSALPPRSMAQVSYPGGSLSRTGTSNDGGMGPSLVPNGSAAAGPSSAPGMGIGPGGAQVVLGAPMAANTIGNKAATAGGGLYQSCVVLRERLWRVPGFGEKWLSEEAVANSSAAEQSAFHDPVTQLISIFRLGAPLCELYNLLNPVAPLSTDLGDGATGNACKKLVAKFIMAVQNDLGFDSDDMFTVMQVFRENTNDWVQVFRVTSKLVDKLEELGMLLESEHGAVGIDEAQKPSDDRAWIVKELLDSERKYVQDLEVLQNCARALQQYDLLTADRLHDLFSNLNNLVDFQRRCLIHIEDNARKTPDEQRFGRAFIMLESSFDVYWPFCANYARALEVITEETINIQRLKSFPGSESCYLDPAYELPAFLIKPVQRICKYPLLLESLAKKSDPNGPYYQELKEGLAIVQRCAAEVNEVRRLQENVQLVKELEGRVEDWKGHNVSTFGKLLLSDTFMVAKNDTEREYAVYLFERILLCCKELVPAAGKKNSKSNSLLKQKTNSIGGTKKPKTLLQLKGRIFINNVTDAIIEPAGPGYSHSLAVQWRGDPEVESFSLRCKNDEQLKQWQSSIQRLIEEAALRRQNSMNNGNYYSGSSSPVNYAGAGANGRRNTGPSMSHFPPQTPINETASHVYPFARADSQMSQRPAEYDEYQGEQNGMVSAGGRGTPSQPGRLSQPEQHRQNSLGSDLKPRARTEDQESATMSQWRSHSPAVAPPLPRQASGSSANGPSEHQVRKTSSSRQLRQNPQAPGVGYPRPPRQGSDPNEPADLRDQMERLHTNGNGLPNSSAAAYYQSRARGDSAAAGMAPSMMRTASESSTSSMGRNRSASASQANMPPQMHAAPPMPHPYRSQQQAQYHNGHGEPLHINTSQSRGPPAQQPHSAGVNGNVYNGEANGVDKRFSASSTSTLDSNQSAHSRHGSTATSASSPLTLSGSSGGGGHGSAPTSATKMQSGPTIPRRTGSSGQRSHHHNHQHGSSTVTSPSSTSRSTSTTSSNSTIVSPSSATNGNVIRIQVHFNDDVFLLAVLSSITFAALLEKVATKVRICGGPNGGPHNSNIYATKRVSETKAMLRLRYIDEDGDKISMKDDDDVLMAIEAARFAGTDVKLFVA